MLELHRRGERQCHVIVCPYILAVGGYWELNGIHNIGDDTQGTCGVHTLCEIHYDVFCIMEHNKNHYHEMLSLTNDEDPKYYYHIHGE